jgi:hypothetical protein
MPRHLWSLRHPVLRSPDRRGRPAVQRSRDRAPPAGATAGRLDRPAIGENMLRDRMPTAHPRRPRRRPNQGRRHSRPVWRSQADDGKGSLPPPRRCPVQLPPAGDAAAGRRDIAAAPARSWSARSTGHRPISTCIRCRTWRAVDIRRWTVRPSRSRSIPNSSALTSPAGGSPGCRRVHPSARRTACRPIRPSEQCGKRPPELPSADQMRCWRVRSIEPRRDPTSAHPHSFRLPGGSAVSIAPRQSVTFTSTRWSVERARASAVRRTGARSPEALQAADFTSIFFCCSTAFAVFGMVTVSTPFEKSAAILS